MQLDPRFAFVPVMKVTGIEAGKASDLLPKNGYLVASNSEMITGYPFSFRQSEQLRNDYTEAMMREYGFGRETAEQLRSDEIDAMIYGFDPADPDGSRSVAMTQFADDMAKFPNDPNATTKISEWLANGGFEKDMAICTESINYWAEVAKEIAKHPIKRWIRATWWMICQMLRKK